MKPERPNGSAPEQKMIRAGIIITAVNIGLFLLEIAIYLFCIKP